MIKLNLAISAMLEKLNQAFSNLWDSIILNIPNLIIGSLFLTIFIILGYFLRLLTRRRLFRRIQDRLLVNFIGRLIFIIFLMIGMVLFLNQMGLGGAVGGILAGAGVSAIILGFAFKDIGENFIAGFFLALSRPFNIGDVVEIEGIKGSVIALHFRNTHIRTFDGRDVFMPNAILIKNPVQNFTRDGLLRYDFVVGLDYGDDIAEAGKVIMDTLRSESQIEHSGELAPFILLDKFGASTINIRIFYWVSSVGFNSPIAFLQTALMNKVVVELVKAGFTLPADIIELKIYQEGKPIPVSLSGSGKK
ncbi:MAG: mechanosensitive ion channel family protein [Bacteroidetes bacterium]|nr:mechanosensitive ion channel family protein [Bacteroidota bacterium]